MRAWVVLEYWIKVMRESRILDWGARVWVAELWEGEVR